jgi:spore coat protein A, manganese oxidase
MNVSRTFHSHGGKRLSHGVAALLTAVALLLVLATAAIAQAPPVAQTPLNPRTIPQFVDPLPGLGDMGTINATMSTNFNLTMSEFKTNVLPSGFVLPNGQTYGGTWTWGYLEDGQTGRESYLGPVIIASRGTPTSVTYINDLGTVESTNVLAYKNSVDQTLHWADPLGGEANMGNMDIVPMMPPMPPFDQVYQGPIPATAHLHGGEVPPEVDGGPDSWFLSQAPTTQEQLDNPDWKMHGSGYYSDPAFAGTTPANGATYTYPNTQEAAPIWFHDHTLGATRLNVYAGLAGAYVLTDPDLELPAGLDAVGLKRTSPTADDTIVPLVIQDRMFDTNGQLYFPNLGINPEHPYWVPEFIGDTVVVNGKAWPYKNVKAQRYRFLFLNGSNARTYDMRFAISSGSGTAPLMWRIGSEGGYFDKPVKMNNLVLMPGQRADVIVDFRGLAPGTRLLLKNVAKAPYPAGATPDGRTTGRVMEFRVVSGAVATDSSFNPAVKGITIKGGAGQAPANVRLANPATGALATGVTADVTRSLTLNEVMGMPMAPYPGGPLEILVNNTKWSGESARTYDDFTPVTRDGVTTMYSELLQEGQTEVWEFVNLTADAHPMHLHLAQFQLLNRQSLDVANYTLAYDAAFPDGAYIPGFGPPSDYNVPNAAGSIGGNPAVTPFLSGPVKLPAAEEAGWTDTILVPPGAVTRIAVRWAPTDTPVTATAASLIYPFDPSGGGAYGYVWHCHIVDHEDNEMMRPDIVTRNPVAFPAP